MRLKSLLIVSMLTLSGCYEVTPQSYDRSEWLPRWSDVDGDCQNTRQELLIRLSLAPVAFSNEKSCTVVSGLWMDPYTGRFFEKASDLDVEHIVPLSWAHKYGGASWSREQRRAFAEDPANLWLVDDGHNRSKGDKGPDQWLPPYKPAQAIYIRQFEVVARKYRLGD
ncbi:HNH endonuclease family protein [Microbulbifer sp. VAAF005]|uniref:HNH endonuclease family protein n=1 Tax=Microbulbifer sp. VAAF005 TaxID=3034230 RepID=UPI0024AD9918|nr:HNH endonuclease family protein [Microbulbifer sp. VAAF005]WHI47907.1 HNH endonuclease family protein [Microbulbifer sp. VAAF005]